MLLHCVEGCKAKVCDVYTIIVLLQMYCDGLSVPGAARRAGRGGGFTVSRGETASKPSPARGPLAPSAAGAAAVHTKTKIKQQFRKKRLRNEELARYVLRIFVISV
jgi:hypothetical protein